MKPTYKNLDAMPTWKLEDLCNHPYNQGIDGADYGPVVDELRAILWQRYNAEAERRAHQHEQQLKAQFRATYRRTK